MNLARIPRIFLGGLLVENPLLMLMIGLCSALAVTDAVANAVGMSAAMALVLVLSELIISLFRKLIPDSIRMPVFIVVIAAFTTMADLVLQAWFPELSKAMGVFIPLIVVNCIIMGRVEAFASKKPPLDAVADGLGMGLGYAWVMVGIAAVREVLGAGRILGHQLFPDEFTVKFFSLPPGGFFVFALFISINIALKRAVEARRRGRR